MTQAAHTSPALLDEPVKAVYKHVDSLLTGIAAVKALGVGEISVMSPIPRHEVEEMLYEGRPSPVRWFTLCGGMFGATMAFSLASLTHANWPMIIPGGKPLVSVPPFLVITFEGMILWGSLFTLVGLILNCRLPAHDLHKSIQDPRFTDDCFGIVVQNVHAHDEVRLKAALQSSGAIEVSGGSVAEGSHHA